MSSITKLLFVIVLFYCSPDATNQKVDYREEMRNFVIEIGEFARTQNPGFIVIPQNGHELLSLDSTHTGRIAEDYLNAIDALGQENLLFGYNMDYEKTPPDDHHYIKGYLELGKQNDIPVLITDYVIESGKVDMSYNRNREFDYISFAASSRDLDQVPGYPEVIPNENNRDITSVRDAKNFLYLLNYQNFKSKDQLLDSLASLNYDLIVMDAFFWGEILTANDLNRIRTKANGGQRLLISYMSIGEAEDYRFYWKDYWAEGFPNWLVKENPEWEGNYKVRYWNEKWKHVIYGTPDSYTQKILDAGFDGVYLDIIDGFWFFENMPAR